MSNCHWVWITNLCPPLSDGWCKGLKRNENECSYLWFLVHHSIYSLCSKTVCIKVLRLWLESGLFLISHCLVTKALASWQDTLHVKSCKSLLHCLLRCPACSLSVIRSTLMSSSVAQHAIPIVMFLAFTAAQLIGSLCCFPFYFSLLCTVWQVGFMYLCTYNKFYNVWMNIDLN